MVFCSVFAPDHGNLFYLFALRPPFQSKHKVGSALKKSTTNSLFSFDTHYILCYYNLVFKFLCHPEMGVWAIHPGHMLFKLENRVIIMPFFTAL